MGCISWGGFFISECFLLRQLRAVKRKNQSEADKFIDLHDVSGGFDPCYCAHVFTLPLFDIKRKVLQMLCGKQRSELHFLRYLSAIFWKTGN